MATNEMTKNLSSSDNPSSSGVSSSMATVANKCGRCGVTTNLGLINCKHATVCLRCLQGMTETGELCSECGVRVAQLQLHQEMTKNLSSSDNPSSSGVSSSMATVANECGRCGVTTNLGLINCKHATVCLRCLQGMTETGELCSECGVRVAQLQLHQEMTKNLSSSDNPSSSGVSSSMATVANECGRCGVTTNLGLINCKHATVCLRCLQGMTETGELCSECGVRVAQLQLHQPFNEILDIFGENPNHFMPSTTIECGRCGANSNLALISCRHATVCLPCFKLMLEAQESCAICKVLITQLQVINTNTSVQQPMSNGCCSQCGCDSKVGLTNCRHMLVCVRCVTVMAQTNVACVLCGVLVTRWIKEYPIRLDSDDRTHYVAQFRKDRPLPLLVNTVSSNDDPLSFVEDQEGIRYKGHQEATSSQYYVIREEEGSLLATPVDHWYSFKRFHPGKYNTEEAEEVMQKRTEKSSKLVEKVGKLSTGQEKPKSIGSPSRGDDWDYKSESSEEDVGNSESRAPKAMREFEEEDNEPFLSNSGRDMKNILKKVKDSEKK